MFKTPKHTNSVLFFNFSLSQQAKNYIRSLPKAPKKDLHTIFSKASSNGM